MKAIEDFSFSLATLTSLMVRSRLALKIPPNLRLQKTCEPLSVRAMYAWDIEREQHLLNYNRLQASQNADVNITKSAIVNKNPVLHDQHVFTKVKLSTDEPCTNVTHASTEEAEVVHINRKSADEWC